eukprot:TRINITY_DN3855_c0_g2_i1.p1 TRINITY_DN3855_c0_g2~~TRINITY_DN3855_c0_g2_i1.p1  ORF type:complete len:348 (+),score=119.18 TRINITY_DN3855_c0_g2_i1:26-1069(+)
MDDAELWFYFLAVLSPTLVAVYGMKNKSVSTSGAIAGWIVGLLSFLGGHFLLLVCFFLTSSRITKIGTEYKKKVDDEFKEGGQRTWVQVICNSAPAVAFGMVYMFFFGHQIQPLSAALPLATSLQVGIVAHYAECAGDTWASELGIFESSPRLITNCKRVPKGTNGGVSIIGVIASMLGGTFIGVCFYFFNQFSVNSSSLSSTSSSAVPAQWPIIVIGFLAGFLGSLFDSLLGATLQLSSLDTTTNRVVSSAVVRAKTPLLSSSSPSSSSPSLSPSSSSSPSPSPSPSPSRSPFVRIAGLDVLDNHQVNLLSSAITSIVFAYLSVKFFPVDSSVLPTQDFVNVHTSS